MSLRVEQSVLGGLLMKPEAFDEVSFLTVQDFSDSRNRRIYKTIYTMIHENKSVDPLTVNDELRSEADLAYMTELVTSTPSIANIGAYAQLVRENSQRRGLAVVAEVLRESLDQSDLKAVADKAQAEIEKIMGVTEKNEPISLSDAMLDYLNNLEKRLQSDGGTYFPTGYTDLDKKLSGGFRGGEIIIIAGRPKSGKTSLAMNIAINQSQKNNVLFLSQEMKTRDLMDRNVARLGQIEIGALLNPKTMKEDDWTRVVNATEIGQSLKLHIDDQGGLTAMDVRIKARAMKRKVGLDVLYIDYLQLMHGTGDSRNNEIEGIMRSLKALALEMDIPIVILSQLNRGVEQRNNKRPLPSDFRDSGSIEQDCSVALMIYRDEVYNPDTEDKGICEVNVALNRQGETGVIGLAFDGARSTFKNLAIGTEFGKVETKAKYSGFKE